MYAAQRGKTEFVRLLIAGGADVNAKDKSGGTALAIAIQTNTTMSSNC